TDKALVYDLDESAEVHNYDNCYDNEIFNMFTQEEQYTELLEPILESHQYKAFELEIERLLREVVSQDIRSIVQNSTVVETFNLQTKLDRVDNIPNTRRPQPRSNTKKDKVSSMSKSSCIMNKEVNVEEHPRNLLLSKNKKHMPSECNNVKLVIQNDKSKKLTVNVSNIKNQKKQKPKVTKPKKVGSNERLASPKPSKPRICLRWSPTGRLFDLQEKIIASSESEIQSDCSNGDNACNSNPPEPTIKRFPNSTSFLGSNDHVAAILGFVDLQWGNILITKVYFIEVLGHNLFLVGRFYDSDLKVHFIGSKHEALEVIKTFLKRINVLLQTPQQNEVVERQNRTLVEAAKNNVDFLLCTVILISKPELQSMTSGQISSGLDLIYAPSTITTQQPTEGELDLLFKAMYDNYIGDQPTSQDIDGLKTQQQHDQQQENQAPLQAKTVVDNVLNAMLDGNTFVNAFATPSTSNIESSSLEYMDPSNIHIMCMYALTVSTMEPKNVKEAMTNTAWIESMQEELIQFKRLDEDVYVCQPEGFIDVDHPTHVYKLKKEQYGLKQAPRAWYDELLTFLFQNHFFKVTINPTLFIRCFKGDILVVHVYVDDIFFGSTHPRSDIVHATCLCSWYKANPIKKHLKEVKRIFCYLKGTINTNLWYTKDSGFELTGFSDADYLGCKATFKSTFDGAQFIGEKLPYPVTQSVRNHFIKEHVEKGTIELYFVKTDYQLADLFTKALPEIDSTIWFVALLLELMLLKRSKENTKCVSAAGEELTAAEHELILLV
nr:copia protein [Tanacetum cinerariifolium]